MTLRTPSTLIWLYACWKWRRLERECLFSQRMIFERGVELATGVAWPGAFLFMTPSVIKQAWEYTLERVPATSSLHGVKA